MDADPPVLEKKPYHHGNLRVAMIESTLDFISVRGFDQVTVSEVARHLGVSPAAPFRHFPTRDSLMAAVAEQVQADLVASIRAGIASTPAHEPWDLIDAIGSTYLRWAIEKPSHFLVFSNRFLFVEESDSSFIELDSSLQRIVDRALGLNSAESFEAVAVKIQIRTLLSGLATYYCTGDYRRTETHGIPPKDLLASTWKVFLDSLRRSAKPA